MNILKKILKCVCIVVIIDLLFSLFFFGFLYNYLHNFASLTQIQDNVIKSCNLNITYQIEITAKKVAYKKDYVKSVYDCSDFSRDLAGNLSEVGISAYCVSGFYNCDGIQGHTWVSVMVGNETYNVEVTQGYIIDDKEYKKCYLEVSKGYCL